MTNEEAKNRAKEMTYEDAFYNLKKARAIPYKKATLIKINELIERYTIEKIGMFAELYGIPEKKGHWIKKEYSFECSECHSERAYGNEYCPDCGSHNGDVRIMPVIENAEALTGGEE
jgi:hypothetical protein